MKITKITNQALMNYYPETLRLKIEPMPARAILRREFCRRLVSTNKCTGSCNNCQPYITDVFDRLSSSEDIRNYEAVMTWHCKNTAAKITEKKVQEPYKPPVDAFDRPIEINLFTQFIQSIT